MIANSDIILLSSKPSPLKGDMSSMFSIQYMIYVENHMDGEDVPLQTDCSLHASSSAHDKFILDKVIIGL